ncbi:FUSC family protein [Streptomyces sp. NBC_00038]|uniref:FUSC family protein n=1 Tax=Streptomyces sp. NBC_00038 TaxID=2903615 RepID=UPI00224F8098|nr:FUSC family protein [Streptomyces sp. NBC_00038]MCX5559577.1 FUSC family protein [Streptomyces sp. NBC_00038]
MSWLRALRETTRSGLRVERKRLEPLIALRGAVGLALVIAVSLWAFGPGAAASSAFGAFQAAIATFQRSWRPRPELALASGTSLAVSTFLGYLTISHLVLFLALLVVWTFLAGMSWAAGPTIGLIASSNVAIMLVTVTLPTSVAQAAGHAAMMVVGGLVQAVLVVLFPVRRWGAHRDALADALASEADYARRLHEDPVTPFDPLPLMEARNAAAVTPRQARTRPAELHGTRGLAERIRPVLASLADPAMGVPPEGRARDRVRELLAAAATILDATAHAIRHGTPVSLPPNAVSTFRTPDTGSILTGPPYRAARRLKTLLEDVAETAGGTQEDPPSRLRTTATAAGMRALTTVLAVGMRAARGGTGGHSGTLQAQASAPTPTPAPTPGTGKPTPTPPKLRPTLPQLIPVALRSMRRELHRGSPITRHATRVTAVAATGYLLGTWLPLGHGYWAPLTSVMVMRPDFSQTYSRAVARFGGTLVGVALATGVVQAAHPDTNLSATLAVISAAFMYLLMRTGQIAAQACTAAYVVFLLGMGGEEWTQTVPERVLLTLLGGLLAVIAYAVYPAWETPRLRTRLADWLSALGSYAAAVVTRYADPTTGATADPSTGATATSDVREALLRSRAARASWHAAVARAQDEPVRHRGLSRTAAEDAEDALAQLGRVAMLMEAHFPNREAPPAPAAARFAEALRTATEQGAKAIRERRVPRWDAVREALEAWDGAGVPEGGPEAVVRQGAGLLLNSLTELSEALDTAVPPMTAGGSAKTAGSAKTNGSKNTNGPRNPKDPATRQ